MGRAVPQARSHGDLPGMSVRESKRAALLYTEPGHTELVASINKQIRAERKFSPDFVVRKRGDQDPQESLEVPPTGEDPKGAGNLPSHERPRANSTR